MASLVTLFQLTVLFGAFLWAIEGFSSDAFVVRFATLLFSRAFTLYDWVYWAVVQCLNVMSLTGWFQSLPTSLRDAFPETRDL